MENNKLCHWLLYYSRGGSKIISSETLLDVDFNFAIKQRLCTSSCYFDCGQALFCNFPAHTSGFVGILDYLVHNKGNVMAELKEDEQRVYINKLSNYENFSMIHHVSIIKCFMKLYTCQLAPCEIIGQAIEALGVFGSIDNTADQLTFRRVQRSLNRWLTEVATVGLRREFKKESREELTSILDNSAIGSLLVYAMMFYARTKMAKYTVIVPDADSSSINSLSNSALSADHSRIVLAAYADISDNNDLLPSGMEGLLSTSMDNVPTTLTIALIFHLIVGNSLKYSDSVLTRSISSTNSVNQDTTCTKESTSQPINDLGYNITSEPMSFSLKAQFQQKLKEKQLFVNAISAANGTVTNETTWLAQSNKLGTNHIPLTPKKVMKSTDNIANIDTSQCLSRSQLNQIQIQLSLQRQKIENDKKTIAEKTDKRMENFKQRAFFQAIDSDTRVARRKSVEFEDGISSKERRDADKRLSMYIKRTETNQELSPIKILGSKDILKSFAIKNNTVRAAKDSCNDMFTDKNITDLPQSLKDCEVELLPVKLCSDKRDPTLLLVNGESESNSRNNNCLPSSNHPVLAHPDYQKSIDFLSNSVTTLQEEIHLLRQQQLSWHKQVDGRQPAKIEVEDTNFIHTDKFSSLNNSVAEIPTNNGVSLTEISDLSKHLPSPCALSGENEQDISVSQSSKNHSTDYSNEQFDQEIESVNYKELLASSATSSTRSPDLVEEAKGGPISFVINEEQDEIEPSANTEEFCSNIEEKRHLKLEMFKQKRKFDRDNRVDTTNGNLVEPKLPKEHGIEKSNAWSIECSANKNEETKHSDSPRKPRSTSFVANSVKSLKKAQVFKSNIRQIKPESMDNLSLTGSQNMKPLPTISTNQRFTSSSTSKLNVNDGLPLPPQEYVGPKLFGKKKVKSNRSVIANAVSYCCLAGSVNIPVKEAVLKMLNESDGTHFMILFRDSRCQFRSLYIFDLNTDDLNLLNGNGPKRITHEMVDKFFKYNIGTKQFNPIVSTKHLSTAVDAICIHACHWNTKPAGHTLTGAVSTNSIIGQNKTKRL